MNLNLICSDFFLVAPTFYASYADRSGVQFPARRPAILNEIFHSVLQAFHANSGIAP
jgi:hypothetical protein